ncbi:MAG: hypothetical protein EXS10_10175 [Phycisphaerales bacterium]|nr:hypothetical protein [Phycisphaerales bacterium]
MNRCTNVFIAAIAGAVAFFIWGVAAHMFLHLGERNWSSLPNEDAIVAEMGKNTPLPGVYFFPFSDCSSSDEAAMAEYEKKYATSPAGLLFYKPVGGDMDFPSVMAQEFLGGFAAAALVAFIVGSLPLGMRGTAVMCGLFALAVCCSNEWSNHIWYGYPLGWIVDGAIESVVGWILAGAVIGKIAGGRFMPAQS